MQTQYKAIFSDIDGTLITSDHKISPKTEFAIKNVLAQGVPFILVSARPPSAMTVYTRDAQAVDNVELYVASLLDF
ncbi:MULTISPECIES: HAD family hydrolase [Glaesserella]|uniref:HAD family hydrolase n=1 Tax=Glaesserella TaxID=2094023 RepID=UPI001EE02A4D|nr:MULTISPECIES: HAD hydrolase family protein [Glaesserella]